ncbi:hypothetical protein V500_00081 [Pseudogymnoascus sp. VKM F-4518 (FW-2643)]|nr:hypothetical protein V500_00081 [Pseudogymnoascus sp. VKM F-4518 (FW-2643)]
MAEIRDRAKKVNASCEKQTGADSDGGHADADRAVVGVLEGGEKPWEDCAGPCDVVIDEDADGGLHGGDHGRQLGALVGNGDAVNLDGWVSEVLGEVEVRPELFHVIGYGGDENRDIFTAVFGIAEDWIGAIEVLTNEVADESAIAEGQEKVYGDHDEGD